MNRHKKIIIPIGVLVSLIAIALLVSFTGWKGYQNAYENWHSELSKQTNNALELSSKTAKDKEEKLTALKKVNEEARKSSDICTPNTLIGWQQSILSRDKVVRDCQELVKRVDGFSDDLRRVIAHLESESKLTAIFNGARTDAEIDETRWGEVVTSWKNATKKIEDLKIPEDFATIKQTSLDAAEAIHKAWQLLVAASKAEDQTKFSSATVSLTESYEKLDNVTKSANKQFDELVGNLEKSYEQAF